MSIRSIFAREARLFLCWTLCFIAVAMGAVYLVDNMDTSRRYSVGGSAPESPPADSGDAPRPAVETVSPAAADSPPGVPADASAAGPAPSGANMANTTSPVKDVAEPSPERTRETAGGGSPPAEYADPGIPAASAPTPGTSESALSGSLPAPGPFPKETGNETPPAVNATTASPEISTASSGPSDGNSAGIPPSAALEQALGADGFRALDPAWYPLIKRLVDDGFDLAKVGKLFAGLGPDSYSPAFMAAKISELHGVSGIGVKNGTESVALPEGYIQPLSDITMGSCKALMTQYAEQFTDIQKQYDVPPNVILAILLVETSLGTDLGDQTALRALGSMATTTTPAMLGRNGNSAQVRRVSRRALNATLSAKSAWAYTELKALISHGEKCGADISKMPGSLYGAVGLCQFMPSNIDPYGVDGDGDGKVDLFSLPDAIYSVASYLKSNGWRNNASHAQKMQVIRTYNMDNFYAAQVLATANQIALGMKGKVADSRSPVVSPPIPASAKDPSLRRRRAIPPAGQVKSLNSYQDILQ